jgi:predicted transcriptional regulator
MASTKEEIIRLVRDQPEDSSFDEILRELAFARMIERGLEDSRADRTIDDEEMRHRIRTWRTYTGQPKLSAG